jgi:surface antigen
MREYADTDSDDYPIRTFTSAADCNKVRVKSPTSVFSLAQFSVRIKLSQKPSGKVKTIVTRTDDGRITCERIALQDSEEWLEAEKERRARQKPPTGSKIGWKSTRSIKLKTMKGMD